MKSITVGKVMSCNPCHDRAWVEARFAGRKRLTVAEIAAIADVSDTDKVWLFGRMMPRKARVLWACDCAARALPHWEKWAATRSGVSAAQRGAPRKAIRVARAWARGRATVAQVQAAATALAAAAAAADAAHAAHDAALAAHDAHDAAAAHDADAALAALAAHDAADAAAAYALDADAAAAYAHAAHDAADAAALAAAYADYAADAAATTAERASERAWQVARAVAYLCQGR